MHDKSLFDLHADAQQRDQRRYIQSRLADVAAYDPEAAQLLKELVELGLSREKKKKDQDGVWAHAQWCVLSRRHAEILCDNTEPHRQRRAVFLRAYSLLFQGGGGGLPRGCSDVHENLTLAHIYRCRRRCWRATRSRMMQWASMMMVWHLFLFSDQRARTNQARPHERARARTRARVHTHIVVHTQVKRWTGCFAASRQRT